MQTLRSMSRSPLVAATAAAVAFTLFLTWPQCLYLGTRIASHNDPYFSMWRLAWIAHALGTDPHHLYDANIFYPEPRTLAYSDATLLQGALATPLLWAGWRLVGVYNVLLLGGIAASGVGMFVLVRYLTGNVGAALVSAACFTLVPYRIEHYMHLELQWTMWIPLTFWATHRAFAEQSWRWGALTGVLLWLQVLSCVYYGIFLAMIVALLGVLLAITTPREAPVGLAALVLGAMIAGLLTIPYAWPYIENVRMLGPRSPADIAAYSASFSSYMATPWQNWMWGWTGDSFTGNELHLSPGIMMVVLGVLALIRRPRRVVWIYVALCAAAVEMSLGINGQAYPWLHGHIPSIGGLRAMARFSILAFSALAVLAGLGTDYLQQQFSRRRAGEWVCASAIIALVLETGSAPMPLTEVPVKVPDIYRVVSRLEPGVIVELPMAEPQWIPGFDELYQDRSTVHWRPLVNGYSGYVSRRYVDTLSQMLTFPDDASIAHLKKLGVRYLLIHQALYDTHSQFADLVSRIASRPELVSAGHYRDWVGNTELFELH